MAVDDAPGQPRRQGAAGAAAAHKDRARALAKLGRYDAAIAHFKAALAIDPADAATENSLGNALGRLGRHAEAAERYRKAFALRPNFAEALNNLGNALAALNRHDDAIAQYRKALTVAPALVEINNNLGSSLEAVDRTEEAILCYDKVLAAHPENAAAHHLRAYALRTLGRLEESRAAFERAVALAPGRTDFYPGLAESKRFAAGDPHLLAMERLARDIGAHPPEAQIELHFALAKAYEDLDRHETAFGHLLQGNALQRQRVAYDEPATLELFRRIAAVFSPELMRKQQGHGDPSTVPIFIIGMPRSGTTLVEQVLASHPKVRAAGEIAAFNRGAGDFWGPGAAPARFPEEVAFAAPQQLRQLAVDYLGSLIAKAPRAERITDKTLPNFQFAGLIHLALPNARIVHLRRDPVDTCFSAFSKLFPNAQPHTNDLAELGRYYRGYDALMTHWRSVLPDGVMLEMHYEEVVGDIAAQARRLVAFCGLDWDESCLAFHQTQRPVRTASAVQVRQPIYRSAVGRSLPYREMLDPLRQGLGIK